MACDRAVPEYLPASCSAFLRWTGVNYPIHGPSRLSRHTPRQETLQLPGSHRMLQFSNRFRLNLSNTLASHFEYPPHFFEGVRISITNPISQLNNFPLAVS